MFEIKSVYPIRPDRHHIEHTIHQYYTHHMGILGDSSQDSPSATNPTRSDFVNSWSRTKDEDDDRMRGGAQDLTVRIIATFARSLEFTLHGNRAKMVQSVHYKG